MFASRAHLFGDMISDHLARTQGTAFRDLFEAHLNYGYSMMGKKWWKGFV